jgi:ribosome silencing factor RsfS/YbeB/iojap
MAKVTKTTTVTKSSSKAAKPAAKPAAKTVVKKVAAKAPVKAAPAKKVASKPAAKPAVKPAAKAAVKTAAKPAVKAATRSTTKTAAKPVSKKTGAATKPAAKKSGTTGKAAKAVASSPFKSAAPSTPKPGSKSKTSAKKPAGKSGGKVAAAPARPSATAKPQAPISLKGLRVSGDKAARIAQIVAESFLNKAAADTKAQDQASSYTITPSANPIVADEGSALEAAHKAAAVLFAKKAEEVLLMDLRNLSTVADYYLIATCTNEPQMRSILSTVQRSLSREGIKSLRSEYMPGVRWAVVDYGDMILHLFEKQTRGFYSLERLWADAPSTLLKASDYALPVSDDDEDAEDDGDL